ncbi:serine protease inhibitor 42Dd-like [Drosophila pseudoobscura]|uniref:Serine protease inhibitor 42Dd-like n=1 Tax=Drosophila pseudoobscura pseudoobscura TaxID=46245 RepID=A0A6I8WDM7_DROPS|nr:serine protease inhibitor 42Dd-like [Drosophila pseudoobscura]
MMGRTHQRSSGHSSNYSSVLCRSPGSMTALSLLLLLGSLLTIVQTDTSTGDTKFALELLRALARDKSSPNIVFSPSSIRTALALAYLGAEGVTGEELKQTLSLEGSDKNDVAQRFAHLLAQEENQSEDDAQFSYANRIYVSERYRLIQAYQELAGKYFNASAENVNFADNFKVSQQINSWVATKTHDQIKDLISADSLSSETAAVLINAIYFKGKWENPFSETMTATHDFTTRFGEKVKTSFMFQWQFFRHAELPSLKATALEMRYRGTDIVLLIILPLEEQGLYALEEKISVLDLNEISSQMREEHVRLQMPKFKLEFEVSLKPVLQQLGIKTMFGPNADFSSLAKGRDIMISEVKHKAFMDVNENGTTAAASTYLLAMPHSGRKGQTIPFIVDHPFLFAIKDEQSIFFLGHVTRP